MMKLAGTFLLLGIVAAFLGFSGLAGASFALAKLFAFLFAVLFLLFLVLGLTAPRRFSA